MATCHNGHQANSYGECLDRSCPDHVDARNPPPDSPPPPSTEDGDDG